jgi:hypothetical protein
LTFQRLGLEDMRRVLEKQIIRRAVMDRHSLLVQADVEDVFRRFRVSLAVASPAR